MNVQDIMTPNPACCTPETSLRDVARLMVEHCCGSVPVVENSSSQKLIGIITDRDIVCRTIANGQNPMTMTVSQCFSQPVVTATPDMSLEDCCKLMEQKQVRRVPVVDANGCCCGIVAQADFAQKAPEHETAELLKELSRPIGIPSAV
ncbi:MAG TPA: CBS domain-containing protein [Chthonomonadaceae bacterium]|nr:CBS domain-containing protein [Chthonomonadaceae bacterium]